MTTRDLQASAKANAGDALARAMGIALIDSVIPLATVIENPNNHRRNDSGAETQEDIELTESIRTHGILQPVLVWKGEAASHHLIAGHRRCRCARRAGVTEVPARIIQGKPSDETVQLLAFLENIQRLDIDAIEFGLGCLAMLPPCGTASQVAKIIHKSVSTVTRAIGLVQKLPADVREHIKPGGGLPSSVARELISLPDDDGKRKIAKLYLSGTLKTRADVIAAVRAAKNGARTATSEPARFACDARGIRVSVSASKGTLTLADAEAVLRELLKDLRGYRGRSVAQFQELLDAKAREAAKAAELQAAQDALAGRLKPAGTPS